MPGCVLDVQVIDNGATINLGYVYSTGALPVVWKNYVYLGGSWYLLFEASLPAYANGQVGPITLPWSNMGTILFFSAFNAGANGVICYDLEMVDTNQALGEP